MVFFLVPKLHLGTSIGPKLCWEGLAAAEQFFAGKGIPQDALGTYAAAGVLAPPISAPAGRLRHQKNS